jgi:hypothetical protein
MLRKTVDSLPLQKTGHFSGDMGESIYFLLIDSSFCTGVVLA